MPVQMVEIDPRDRPAQADGDPSRGPAATYGGRSIRSSCIRPANAGATGHELLAMGEDEYDADYDPDLLAYDSEFTVEARGVETVPASDRTRRSDTGDPSHPFILSDEQSEQNARAIAAAEAKPSHHRAFTVEESRGRRTSLTTRRRPDKRRTIRQRSRPSMKATGRSRRKAGTAITKCLTAASCWPMPTIACPPRASAR
ncbi:MAG: hypothetical protein WDN06_14470 [Asticcacaulis sp.]